MPSLSSRVSSSSSSAYPSVRSPSSSSKESVCLPRDCERWPAAAASPSPSSVLGHSVVQVLPIAFPGGKCHFCCVKHICKKGKCGIFGPRSQLHTDNFFDFLNIFLNKNSFFLETTLPRIRPVPAPPAAASPPSAPQPQPHLCRPRRAAVGLHPGGGSAGGRQEPEPRGEATRRGRERGAVVDAGAASDLLFFNW